MSSIVINQVDGRNQCEQLDLEDNIAFARDRFLLPDNTIYLDGNSLGPLPAAAVDGLQDVTLSQWGQDLIQSWNKHDWFALPGLLGNRLGKLMGASENQVVVCDSTSINLYKAICAALALRPERSVLLARKDDFPTDLYITEGAASSAGRPVERRLWDGDVETLPALIDDDVAVLLLSHVHYASAEILPMAEITRIAHDAGVLVIWDLCHSIGIVPLELDRCGVDFAVGCTYKYLNGGPGSPAFIYVASDLLAAASQPLSGWWGHRRPFDFSPDYEPRDGIKRFLCGTQPILSIQGVGYGLDAMEDVGIQQIRQKSMQLTRLFMYLVASRCDAFALKLASPENSAVRGGHVSYGFEQGYAVIQAMIDRGVIADFRAPDRMRFGFAPLYIRYVDIWDAVDVMRECLRPEVWSQSCYQVRSVVT